MKPAIFLKFLFFYGITFLSFNVSFAAPPIEPSVVLITNHQQFPNWQSPWERSFTTSSTGTGFLIDKQWILTNAHVVSNSRLLLVKKISSPAPYIAEIVAIAHDSDLAILKVKDPFFYENMEPLTLGKIPVLHSRVRTFGYPQGGTTISRTEGVVSRVEFDTYLHSSVDSHLIIQTDSAINPGNSGGPVIQDGKVVGVAFQSNPELDAVGYMIPTPLVYRFFKDIEDGVYDGVPEIGIQISNLLNKHMRDYLKLPSDMKGVLVDRIIPNTSSVNHLRVGDVLVEIEGKKIDRAGLVEYKGHRVPFHIMAEDKQVGDSLTMRVWRNNEFTGVNFVLRILPFGEEFRLSYDTDPQYLIFGGLVFIPLNRDYIRSGQPSSALIYEHFYREIETGMRRDQVIVMTRVLPSPLNTGYASLKNFIVDRVNGIPIQSLKHLKIVLNRLNENDEIDYYKFDSQWNPIAIILEKKAVSKEHNLILQRYGISKGENL